MQCTVAVRGLESIESTTSGKAQPQVVFSVPRLARPQVESLACVSSVSVLSSTVVSSVNFGTFCFGVIDVKI